MFQLRYITFDIETKITASFAAVFSIIIPFPFNTICYPEDWSHTPHEVVMSQILKQFGLRSRVLRPLSKTTRRV